ncbi:MAG: hypothetical protein F6K58_13580 [Symploca sp. SIO2E9]|nr:hypothetical protein [Symploca sp. SIO2E9]
MTESPKTTLLTLLLALKQLETPLTADEQARLKTVGEQLELDPDDWDYIKEGLMAVIENNPSLNQFYQTAKAQLDAIDGKIPPELLPTEQELEAQLPADEKQRLVKRGYFEGEAERESNEIQNVSTNVLKKDSDKTAKKLPSLDRVQVSIEKPKS